ncbi:MAG: hypothetical protein NTX49_10460 [Chlamydiae bacterium]|nr:hypothetical protein [Chlamydiota bacterium]
MSVNPSSVQASYGNDCFMVGDSAMMIAKSVIGDKAVTLAPPKGSALLGPQLKAAQAFQNSHSVFIPVKPDEYKRDPRSVGERHLEWIL